jgi:hypothetical protein
MTNRTDANSSRQPNFRLLCRISLTRYPGFENLARVRPETVGVLGIPTSR